MTRQSYSRLRLQQQRIPYNITPHSSTRTLPLLQVFIIPPQPLTYWLETYIIMLLPCTKHPQLTIMDSTFSVVDLLHPKLNLHPRLLTLATTTIIITIPKILMELQIIITIAVKPQEPHYLHYTKVIQRLIITSSVVVHVVSSFFFSL